MSLEDWVRVLAGWPATLGLLLAGTGLAFPRRRGLTLMALVACYAFVGVHLAAVTHEVMVPVHLLMGGLAGISLWLGVPRSRRPARRASRSLGFAGALLVALGAVSVGWGIPIPGLSPSQAVAALWCVGVGTVALALSGASRGLVGAVGVLLLLLGGELWVLLQVRDLDLVAPFAGLHLVLAATLGYLLRAGGGEEAGPWR